MLKEGYHKSFRELDEILKLQIEDRHRLGNEHPVWERPLLDQESKKLEYLCNKLNRAEASERAGDHKNLYANYFDLANYFKLTDDSWLADYFFNKCLNITESKNTTLEPQRKAETYCNLGLAFEKQSKFEIVLSIFYTKIIEIKSKRNSILFYLFAQLF